jgi:hypothetical protein
MRHRDMPPAQTTRDLIFLSASYIKQSIRGTNSFRLYELFVRAVLYGYAALQHLCFDGAIEDLRGML